MQVQHRWFYSLLLVLLLTVVPVFAGTTTTLKPGTSTTVTITLASLANAAYRQSAIVDNSSANNLEYIITLKAKSGSGTNAAGAVQIYVCASFDGTTFEGGCNGTGDAGYTPTVTPLPNIHQIGELSLNADAKTDQISFSVAASFNGIAPVKFQVIVLNSTGAALDSTAGNFSLSYVAYALQNN